MNDPLEAPTLQLTDEQSAVVRQIGNRLYEWRYPHRPEWEGMPAPLITAGGYAGTGKTTMLKFLLDSQNVDGPYLAPCAYTGKAASVLRAKGVSNAKTIHSTIYKPAEDENGKTHFQSIPKHELACDGFLIDEASMVSAEILDDLKSFNLPIVAIGDPGQLPPISPKDVNLMQNPDYVLEKIHRQAEGNPIIQYATEVRLGMGNYRALRSAHSEQGSLDVIDRYYVVTDKEWLWPDIVICAFNKTRAAVNFQQRRRRGIGQNADDKMPIRVFERIICLQNDTDLGVFNGMMGTVLDIVDVGRRLLLMRGADPYEQAFLSCKVQWDGEDVARAMDISTFAVGVEKIAGAPELMGHRSRLVLADYGYAVTCHKAQGSQWDKVLVINEEAGDLWDQKRWLYTAVTRAAKQLVVRV